MLVMPTPSIAQQRLALLLFLVLIGAAVVWQNAGGRTDRVVRKFTQTPAPEIFSALDFTSAEAAWRELRVDAQGNLQIDAMTESALLEAMAFANDQRADGSMARMVFLLEKQFGAIATRQIIDLLPRLRRYKEAEQRWWAQNGSMDPPPHAELFRLQDELLGATLAERLFSQQRRLMNLMLASQRIRNDTSLTPAQRDRALMDLQKGGYAGEASVE